MHPSALAGPCRCMSMTNRLWVYSGDRPSNGAKELANLGGFLRLRHDRFHKVKAGDVIINWGVSKAFQTQNQVINPPQGISVATDKLQAFQVLSEKGVKTVDWTAKQDAAQSWADAENVVVVRNKLTGHSGDGIVIVDKLGEVPPAPLYTRYLFKVREYRVHVCMGKVIDTAQKIKDPDREVINWKVRSHENGFIFARNNLQPSPERDGLALVAVQALGLDFGAVDIVEDKKGNFYVLEVNTAPGLEGQTIQSYAEGFINGC